MARRWRPVLVVALAISVTAVTHAKISPTPRALEEHAIVPRPEVAQAFSLGFDSLLADYYWLQAIQVVGGEDVDPSQHALHLGRLIDVVTTLDPWVDHPYRFAAIWLTDSEESVRTANRLLERGIAHHPVEWRNHFYLGFNHFFYLQENATAADVLERASQLPGSPRYLPRLVARLRSAGVDLGTAQLFLEQMVRDATDAYHRAEYRGALDEIGVERKARFLDQAREAYRQRTGKDIREVEDLVRGPDRVLTELPDPEPSSLPSELRRHAQWTLDPESGRIVSSYYGRRYELTFHTIDRQRRERWQQQRRARGEEARREG